MLRPLPVGSIQPSQYGRSLLLALQLRMAIGAFQKAGVCMAQQFRRHLLTGIVLQQIGSKEMPQGILMTNAPLSR